MNDTHEASCFAENLQSSRRMLVKNKDAGDIPLEQPMEVPSRRLKTKERSKFRGNNRGNC